MEQSGLTRWNVAELAVLYTLRSVFGSSLRLAQICILVKSSFFQIGILVNFAFSSNLRFDY